MIKEDKESLDSYFENFVKNNGDIYLQLNAINFSFHTKIKIDI